MSVTLLTTTFYRCTDELRFSLACQTIRIALGYGYRIMIVDGSDDEEIRGILSALGAEVQKQEAAGIGASRRQLFQWALAANTAEDEVFVWLEPEKTDLIRFILRIIGPIRLGFGEIVIPRRTTISWATYPEFQVGSERKANEEYATATGHSYDIMFGPVAFTRRILEKYFATCNPAEQYGGYDTYIQHIGPMYAMADGVAVDEVEVNFVYPTEQREQEERELRAEMLQKRQRQLAECVRNYRLASQHLSAAENSLCD